MDEITNVLIGGSQELKRVVEYQEPSILQRLEQKKSRLELQLKEVNDAIKALQVNPEVANVLTLVGKAIR